jgi:hypothetical protein
MIAAEINLEPSGKSPIGEVLRIDQVMAHDQRIIQQYGFHVLGDHAKNKPQRQHIAGIPEVR